VVWAILLFVVAPIIELYVFVQVANAFGFGQALGAMVVITLVGVWIVKHEGMRVWRRFTELANAGKPVSKEVADGTLILLAGVLLIAPGFISDIFGVLLLIPPVRALVRPLLVRRYSVRGRVIKATYGGPVYDATEHGPVHDTTEHTRPHELEE
jgi:UPF0716 protein FxsA